MKKFLEVLIIAGLFATGAYAKEIPEVSLPKVEPVDVVVVEASLEEMTVKMKTAIESQPISIFDYLHFGYNVIFGIGKKLTTSTRPLVVFSESIRIGGQITLYESRYFNLTAGRFLMEQGGAETPVTLGFEPSWFFGVELKLFTIRPQVLVHQGTWYFGISYQFKDD